ncbi:MAG: NINE protein [Desulfitobacteriaceae bacterium]|nr:NINE protein [Desulfitobacteriaceae bacterium]MDI6879394.1 NINE protein [Desulfitobacteriaceae bacterium]MDI6913067.1 NINE protein [Desulfitobacteriaceae bacterium]
MSEEPRGWNEKFCRECGKVINAQTEICPFCGVRQFNLAGNSGISGRRLAAALFAIFLGSFGAHKFYLGKAGQGILYLVFFWTAIPGIIGLIEGILYLAMSEEAFNARYC